MLYSRAQGSIGATVRTTKIDNLSLMKFPNNTLKVIVFTKLVYK